MIPVPSGVRVWIATGHTDMRRGMRGLALQVQEQLKRDRPRAISTSSVAAAAISRKSSGMTALGCRCTQSDSIAESSSGRRRRQERFRFRRGRWHICRKRSIGESRDGRGGRRAQGERNKLCVGEHFGVPQIAKNVIARLFTIEAGVKGRPPAERAAARRERASLILDELRTFLDSTLAKISGKSDFAKAIRYATSRWTALTRYVDDGCLEMTNNAAERAGRPFMDSTPEAFPDDVAALKAASLVARAKASQDAALIAAQKVRAARSDIRLLT